MGRRNPGLNLNQLAFLPDHNPSRQGSGSSSSANLQQRAGLGANGIGSHIGSSANNSNSSSRLTLAGGSRPGGFNGPPGRLPGAGASPFALFSDYVDPTGNLNFEGKAVISANGVDFSNGKSYKISMHEMQVLEVLGRGQFGIVHKVFHKPTRVTMALKEIRLELNQSALKQIIMELDVLHKARSPYIVDFYGAFFVESRVYYCMEYMDFGSLDRLYPAGVPDPILAKITLSVVKGLQFLKDDLNIIHRDVKPTNILVNRKGEVKLCDFGVSGELNKSLAKTHVGCQSYMAPERIFSTGGPEGYTIQSDVWSLGVTIIEIATGQYPYHISNYDSPFAQLNAIVHGDPPTLPSDRYSPEACDFVAKCLAKSSNTRPLYQDMLKHPWLDAAKTSSVNMEEWASTTHALSLARSSNTPSATMS
ncbi:MAP kinase kinase Wis1 [Dipsacomyces acuminosporus]|nr:MAP kinase kinase Wis1 [Dipsacomyces acuminosporus]